jgi:hypothetical protein
MFFPQESEYIMTESIKRRKPPLYLNLSEYKLIVDCINDLEERVKYDNDDKNGLLTKEEIQLRLKIQTIISYIERAKLRKVY